MPRLFAAEGRTLTRERFEHVPIAHRGLDHIDATRLHREAKAEVAHHRHRHRVASQYTASVAIDGADGDDVIAVDELTAVVDCEHPVGVAVEGQTEIGFAFDDCSLQIVGIRRPAMVIDIAPVGCVVDDLDVGTDRGQHGRGNLAVGAVGAIDHDPKPPQVAALERCDDRVAVAHEICTAVDERSRGTGRDYRIAAIQIVLDPTLREVAQLRASRREQFDAVVGVRVVRRRDHCRRDAIGGREPRDRRCGHHPQRSSLHAAPRQTVGEGLLEVGARLSRVPPDQEGVTAEYRRRDVAQQPHEADGQLVVRTAAPTIGAVSRDHWRRNGEISACCIAAPCAPSSSRTSWIPSCGDRE